MVEMFRITYRRTQVEHVETRKRLAERLLAMESQNLASKDSFRDPKISTFIERMFRKRKGLPETVTHPPFGISVEQLVGEDWVLVPYEFVPSHLVLDGETYDG